MAEALKTGYPRIKPVPIVDERSVSIACYGPSLVDTWQDIQRPIISVSGALHFLAQRGVVPDWHVEVDPRPHKARHLMPPVEGVHYIIGTVCHPNIWEPLKGQKVTLFHTFSDETTEQWIAENDPGEGMLHPGSTVGMTAIHIGGMLGYRHFEIHGMDSSFKDGRRHAGPHYGHPQGGQTWQAGNVVYQTSRIMSNACAEVINTVRNFPIFCVFHGDGLLQALVDEEYGLDNAARTGTPKADMVRKAKLAFIRTA